MQQNFIWDDISSGRKIHAISWNTVTLPKNLGGLGLRDLQAMNNACIIKLSWKLINNSEEIWCKMLRGIYKKVILCRNPTKKSIESGKWNIGDARSVDAWEDDWIETGFCISDRVQFIQKVYEGPWCGI